MSIQTLLKFRWILGLFVLSYSWLCSASDLSNAVDMLTRYQEFRQEIQKTSLPFSLKSRKHVRTISAQVSTFISDVPFQQFIESLSDVSQWCEFIPLHINVKACVYEIKEDRAVLKFFLGPKRYTEPDESKVLEMDFMVNSDNEILQVGFSASVGPFRSRNYDFKLRAMEADNGIYLEFDLSSEPGWVSAIVKVYLSTVGFKKVGFSIVGVNTETGKPLYVKGERGGAERNIVRYLFSIQAYFDTLDWLGSEDGYFRRLERWYDLVDMHPVQLYEMSRAAYLDIKMRERQNQLQLVNS